MAAVGHTAHGRAIKAGGVRVGIGEGGAMHCRSRCEVERPSARPKIAQMGTAVIECPPKIWRDLCWRERRR